MKTGDLIRAIARDAAAPRPALARRLAGALAIGGAVAAVLFSLGLGVRADIGAALGTWRFLLKLAVVLVAFACALWACARLTRPEARLGEVAPALAAAPLLLAAAVALELALVPSGAWAERAIGSNARVCLVAVPVLSIAPLAALLAALRAGAPGSPWAAGAVAGALAGALASALYATHCIDDSPLFVALWYSLAVLPVVLAGALAGGRVLRW
jgi:hypothetical protein